MAGRHEPTGSQWQAVGRLLPGKAGDRGRTAADDRSSVDAVPCVAGTGIPRRDLPERLGRWNGVWRRFSRRCASGVRRCLRVVLGEPDLAEPHPDSTTARAHRNAAGGRRPAAGKKGRPTAAAASAAAAAGRAASRTPASMRPAGRCGRSSPQAGRATCRRRRSCRRATAAGGWGRWSPTRLATGTSSGRRCGACGPGPASSRTRRARTGSATAASLAGGATRSNAPSGAPNASAGRRRAASTRRRTSWVSCGSPPSSWTSRRMSTPPRATHSDLRPPMKRKTEARARDFPSGGRLRAGRLSPRLRFGRGRPPDWWSVRWSHVGQALAVRLRDGRPWPALRRAGRCTQPADAPSGGGHDSRFVDAMPFVAGTGIPRTRPARTLRQAERLPAALRPLVRLGRPAAPAMRSRRAGLAPERRRRPPPGRRRKDAADDRRCRGRRPRRAGRQAARRRRCGRPGGAADPHARPGGRCPAGAGAAEGLPPGAGGRCDSNGAGSSGTSAAAGGGWAWWRPTRPATGTSPRPCRGACGRGRASGRTGRARTPSATAASRAAGATGSGAASAASAGWRRAANARQRATTATTTSYCVDAPRARGEELRGLRVARRRPRGPPAECPRGLEEPRVPDRPAPLPASSRGRRHHRYARATVRTLAELGAFKASPPPPCLTSTCLTSTCLTSTCLTSTCSGTTAPARRLRHDGSGSGTTAPAPAPAPAVQACGVQPGA